MRLRRVASTWIAALGLLLWVAPRARADYQIIFDTFNSDFSNPVFDIDGTTRLSGTDGWLAQLHIGITPDSLAPVGNPIAFQSDLGNRGFVAGGLLNPVDTPGIIGDTSAYYVLRVWNQAQGSAFDAVSSIDGARIGTSTIEPITLRGFAPGIDTPPIFGIPIANQHDSFNLVMVPEPGILTIGLLGAAGLFWRRRRT